jgi:hypothetical protein
MEAYLTILIHDYKAVKMFIVQSTGVVHLKDLAQMFTPKVSSCLSFSEIT